MDSKPWAKDCLRRPKQLKLSRALKAEGRTLPKLGHCVRLPGGGRGEVCHSAQSYQRPKHCYYIVGASREEWEAFGRKKSR